MGRPRISRAVQREFWRAVRAGCNVEQAVIVAGVSPRTGRCWFGEGGGMPPMPLAEPSGRYLSFQDREEIMVGLAARESMRSIADRLYRDPSTISREVQRNCLRTSDGSVLVSRYRATVAQDHAEKRARRPKTAKLVAHPPLRDYVQAKLQGEQRWSPEQIARRLPVEFPDDERMRVSHETIYQAIYVQGRGALRRELASCLRTGRALRKPSHADARTSAAAGSGTWCSSPNAPPRSPTGLFPVTGKAT